MFCFVLGDLLGKYLLFLVPEAVLDITAHLDLNMMTGQRPPLGLLSAIRPMGTIQMTHLLC